MRAMFFTEHGEPSNLLIGDRPSPSPGPGEAVVAVEAAALNHLDLFVLRGLPGATIPLPHVPGADGAGTVAAVGAGVRGWREGDEVVINPGLWCGACEFCVRGEESLCVRFAITGEHVDGTLAEFVKVPARNLANKPPHLSWVEAAAFPLTFLTAWRMLVTRGQLAKGQTVLIHGIGGGLAVAALLIAKRLGATVIVTSSSEAKLRRGRELGADEAVNYRDADVVREVRALTGKRGADLVVETVGEATWLASLRCCAKGGRVVTCGATTGPNPREEIRLIFWNQLSILGSTMGGARDWDGMLEAVRDWKLRPVVDRAVPLERGKDAFDLLANGGQFGKIVVTVRRPAAAVGEPDRA